MAEPRFIHLNIHSDYSMIDGLAKTGPLVKKVASMNMPAMAISRWSWPRCGSRLARAVGW